MYRSVTKYVYVQVGFNGVRENLHVDFSYASLFEISINAYELYCI